MKAPLVLLIVCLYYNGFAQCGESRWTIKTLTDNASKTISEEERSTTIHEQNTLQRPKGKWLKLKRQPNESSRLVLAGMLIAWGMEGDGDYHLIVQNTNAETIVCEIPDPDCEDIWNTPNAERYRTARDWVDQHIGIPRRIKPVPTPTPVTIHGIGFWEMKNHGVGHSKNGREIHPVYAIE